jgi:hypothetical protein
VNNELGNNAKGIRHNLIELSRDFPEDLDEYKGKSRDNRHGRDMNQVYSYFKLDIRFSGLLREFQP